MRTFLGMAAVLLSLAAASAEPTDTETTARKNLERLGENGDTVAVAMSPDGKWLASGGLGRVVRLWDTATGKEIRQLEHPRGIYCLAFSGDGKFLVSAGDQRVRLWETASGKEIRCLKVRPGDSFCVAFSPNGKTLATAGETIRLWDLDNGREQGRFGDRVGEFFGVAFSPDGKTIASAGADGGLRLWNVASQKEIRSWAHPSGLNCVAFQPDGQALATSSGNTIHVWNLATGKRKWEASVGLSQSCGSLAFSADGNSLAAGCNGDTSIIRRWAAATGKERATRKGFQNTFVPVLFSTSSHAMAGDDDPLKKLRNVADPERRRLPPAFHLNDDEISLLWTDLGGEQTHLARQAIETLSLDAGQVVPFLKKRLRPEPPFPPLARLLADLDADRFTVRQQATEQLERMGKAAEPALRQVLQNRPSLEVRRRIEMLLERSGRPTLSSKQLRAQAAIEVLRRLDTGEARQLLKELAGGAPETLLTRSAREALGELGEK